jgi:hypothetical protein
MMAPDMTAPDAMSPNAPSATPDTTMPDTSGSSAPSLSSPDTAAAGSDMFITQQAADNQLASAMIGANVRNGADEDLGSINDIVLNDAGEVQAVVIGVGGFLGIGEKNVAVGFDAVDKTTDASGNVVLRLETTREQLEAAPAFVTVAAAGMQQDSTMPAAPAAPAPAQ